jgi:hypothetical protein
LQIEELFAHSNFILLLKMFVEIQKCNNLSDEVFYLTWFGRKCHMALSIYRVSRCQLDNSFGEEKCEFSKSTKFIMPQKDSF